ncbi:MAG: dihydropteroate synthase [Methylophilaceae bacterium 17-44-8]|jgi:dihydropteroate synthase|nr:MAG: dihydropteroate synthase [Methylophilales bacterium 28-44-11]OZA05650.1 MAG: dihydropteroate synthase [Methylophilaceae bacterium 17-44-8]
MILHCAQFKLPLTRPHVMGIVNVTPDSFSDGGQFTHTSSAVAHALSLVAQGADILDVGGESTRPNATPVSLQEELDRVIPVIEALADQIAVPISIDTYKPAVMAAAIQAGASLVNDVRALQEEGALDVVANSDVGICLMHMQGTPQTMQANPQYIDVVQEVKAFLAERAAMCIKAGIEKPRILLDPGFGFGKTRAHNITLIQKLAELQELGFPLLVGLSRKSVLGQVTGQDVDARLHASVAAAVISVMKGAKIVRVHDVKATVEALKVVAAIADQYHEE